MTVRLRPHHLLCILTFVGKGYTPAFTANMAVIVGRLAEGEEIEIIEGPDAICAPLLDEAAPHCHRESVVERDLAAAADVGGLLALTIKPGTRFVLDEARIRQLRHAFAKGRTRSACAGCDWRELCGAVAASGYAGSAFS
ncbi:DUF1284 domain-containing protein [Martelella mangrovi]|uniref:DUF1284 domain-containing protein n=1 Tax=Martelella mangrovi TaxID=1397477 RepID=A0ABV2I9J0_9HYPH